MRAQIDVVHPTVFSDQTIELEFIDMSPMLYIEDRLRIKLISSDGTQLLNVDVKFSEIASTIDVFKLLRR
jgi:hypothetical protein